MEHEIDSNGVVSTDNLREFGHLLARINRGLPQAPGFTSANIRAYAAILAGIPFPVLIDAIVLVLQEWKIATLLPTPGIIHEKCLAVMAARLGIPSPEAAWMEVLKKLHDHGANAKIEWSHPAIGEAVKVMGGQAVVARSDSPMADRSHWLKTIYPAVQKIHISATRANLLPAGQDIPKLEGGQ